MRRLPAAGLIAVVVCGCDPEVNRPDVGGLFEPDMQVTPLTRPTISAFGMAAGVRVPYELVNLTGRSDGARVFIEGASNRLVATVNPDGTFCIDVPLPMIGRYNFSAVAHKEGAVSEPSVALEVERSDQAPLVPGASTCSGADPAGCRGEIEVCGDMRDNDCNGLIDENDPTCATCTDDLFERNDDINAPRVEPGTFPDLQICPGSPDYFGVFAQTGDTITAQISFQHTEGNLDLELIGLDRMSVVQESKTLMNTELITHTASISGEFKVRILADPGVANSYELNLNVVPGS